MSLPIYTSGEDVYKIVDYLKNKATGESIKEVKKVLGKTILDGRKLKAYKLWGIIKTDGNNIKLDELGWKLARSKSENDYLIFNQILRNIKPYNSALELIFHQNFDSVTNVDIAAYWHEHYKSDIGSDKETTIKDMAVCFFHLCQEAGIGKVIFGRRDNPTRLEISKDNLGQYIAESALTTTEVIEEEVPAEKEKAEIQLLKNQKLK